MLPSNPLLRTVQKLLASKCHPVHFPIRCSTLRLANAHRLFVTTDSATGSPILSPSSLGNLSGIVSIVDSRSTFLRRNPHFTCHSFPVLSIFARVANVPDVDPTRMQRHRRASSASSQSEGDQFRSRSSSRTSIHRSPSLILPPMMGMDSTRNSISGLDSLQRVVSLKNLREA